MFKIFHEKTSSDFNKIYDQRFNYDSAVHLRLNIKPMSQPNVYELFYIPSNEMIKTVSKIHLISAEFQKKFDALPKAAQNQFINECLVEELFNTNELEGVKSTREEIARSTKEIQLNKKSKKRFGSMIKSYLTLITDDVHFPKKPQDVREIYDHITEGELDWRELPDGEVFRRESTYVLKKSGTGKVIHHGITPETAIMNAVEKLLHFMNENDDVPPLIKVAIGHYYFGYIHPFYDGNGRTSRFISSMYLTEALGSISTLSLSRGCNKYRNKYLEAFEISNSIKSRGELNYFIETFLAIILEALIEMTAELKEKSELLRMAYEKLNQDPIFENMDKTYTDMMFILAQNHFFDSSSGITIKELAGILAKSEATIRKMIKELLEMSLVDQKGEKPAYYYVKQKYFES
ncbi:Fic family protein [Paenibacillus enshidis]|uniref:Fic family protein n=1 Tax=Paenibacillus enshidis TaxID=1458439 RepID=A0ABV5AW77_9BACL